MERESMTLRGQSLIDLARVAARLNPCPNESQNPNRRPSGAPMFFGLGSQDFILG
jgi:hypothetical protein